MRLDPDTGAVEGEWLLLVHHSPGRLRVRAACFRDASDVADRVRGELGETQGVFCTVHSPLTGSLLIEYSPDIADVESLLASIVDTAGLDGIVDSQAMARSRKPPAEHVVDGARWLDGLARELTGAGLYELIPAVLTVTGVYSLVANPKQKGWLPRWDNALYWAYSVFRDGVHEQEREDAARVSGTVAFRPRPHA
ncbi:HMA2 domain-containing protein [Myxococcus sp. Y35]|uniref:HMA2 domain-containing protein n=1 Tax=Pseudomyxococcus flavus TaxID=3115648 RepID=UPI003CE74EE5